MLIKLEIEVLVKRLIKRLIESFFCSILGGRIVHSCCRSILGSVDNRKVKDDISRVAILVP
jgi:hypothetical protein